MARLPNTGQPNFLAAPPLRAALPFGRTGERMMVPAGASSIALPGQCRCSDAAPFLLHTRGVRARRLHRRTNAEPAASAASARDAPHQLLGRQSDSLCANLRLLRRRTRQPSLTVSRARWAAASDSVRTCKIESAAE